MSRVLLRSRIPSEETAPRDAEAQAIACFQGLQQPQFRSRVCLLHCARYSIDPVQFVGCLSRAFSVLGCLRPRDETRPHETRITCAHRTELWTAPDSLGREPFIYSREESHFQSDPAVNRISSRTAENSGLLCRDEPAAESTLGNSEICQSF
jgi:hypothetical protein